MAGRADEDRLLRDVNAGKALREVCDLAEALVDALGWDLREVEIDAGRDALADATALLDLRRDAATICRVASAIFSGAYFFMKRSPSLLTSSAPSARLDSESRTPLTERPVGWNCTISGSLNGMPTFMPATMPSPVELYGFDVRTQ